MDHCRDLIEEYEKEQLLKGAAKTEERNIAKRTAATSNTSTLSAANDKLVTVKQISNKFKSTSLC